MSKAIPENFGAVLNIQPPKNNSLRVGGTVEVSSAGWKGSLTKAVPQGINPLILILDLRLITPTGQANQVISQIDVQFKEDPAVQKYESVTIRDSGTDFTIAVEVVQ